MALGVAAALDLATGDWCARRAGCQRTFDRVVAAVEASDADIVGLQETTMNAVTLAERLGWHASERTHVGRDGPSAGEVAPGSHAHARRADKRRPGKDAKWHR